ncbi:MAG TPA: ABC transporter ATP-binding protein [Symbiobacteriaceae bacterium]|nr:ABC transporter ATP-binding protein [Symbiobacteriaceae bacterium]
MQIEIRHITKRFLGGVVALDDVSLTIGSGMYGLLGPNGAGKTTLMRILATLLPADRGTVTVGDIDLAADPQSVRGLLGYLPQEIGFYRQLTGPEYLELVAGMKGVPRSRWNSDVAEVLERVHLTDHRGKRIKAYSGGMKRRLGIAQALLGDPKLIIVDEPTSGLDPEERVHFRNLLNDLAGDRTILLSTHIVADVESVCNALAVINRGRVVYSGSAAGLLAKADNRVWQLELPAGEYDRLRHTLQVVSSRRTQTGVQVRVLAPESPFGMAAPADPSLEDGYLCLMGAAGETERAVPA